MRNFLFIDHVVYEKYCNLRCDYCFLSDKFETKITQEEAARYRKELSQAIEMGRVQKALTYKVSGGEILLLPDILDTLQSGISVFRRLQILTNGILLDDNIIKRIREWPNLVLQLSIDGHTAELNRYRFKNNNYYSKILNIINICAAENIPLELNLCLNRRNADFLIDFLNCILEFRHSNLIIYFLPVREDKPVFGILEEQKKCLEGVIKCYDNFKSILPPLTYLKVLEMFLRTGAKPDGWKCYIPELIMGLQEKEMVKLCPEIGANIDLIPISAVNNPNASIERQRLLLKNKCRVYPPCRGCFTHYEILNLYLNKYINKDELSRVYFYNDTIILDNLESIRIKNEL